MVEVSLIGFPQFFRDELLELKVHQLSCLVTMHKMITILPSFFFFFWLSFENIYVSWNGYRGLG